MGQAGNGARRWGWGLFVLVALLHALPFVRAVGGHPPEGRAYVPVGHVPKDSLAYVALLRQVPDSGRFAFANPFDNAPGSGRVLMPLLWLIGAVAAGLRANPFWALELARVPLLALFFWLLWRLTLRVYSDERERKWAVGLVGFSGGLEFLVAPWASHLPAPVGRVFAQELARENGWSTFASLQNPLWIAGLALAVLVLGAIFRPNTRPRNAVAWLGLGGFALYWVHPYSAIAVVAVALVYPVLGWLLDDAPVRQTGGACVSGAILALVLVAPIVFWQLQDPGYGAATGGVFGQQLLSVFWYPLAFGAVGVLALRAWRNPANFFGGHRLGLLSWVVAVALLQSCPFLNGYHFTFFLHLPLALLAAPEVARLDREWTSARQRVWRAGLWALLFLGAAANSLDALADVGERGAVPAGSIALAKRLGTLPPGNVAAPGEVGVLVPAFGPQRSYVGHWFLTPDFRAREEAYWRALDRPQELGSWLSGNDIRYLVLPKERAPAASAALGSRLFGVEPFPPWVLALLEEREAR